MYTESQLVKIAKRENNTKRNYLVVNRLQGKHIPVSPKQALLMFEELAGKVREAYRKEKLLLIGFAETATAIGACVAGYMDCYYMQTTRENIEGAGYLYFSESHSHATEQKLVKNGLEDLAERIDRIVFVEDELTTGNTILKIVELLQKYHVKFAVASLLNGMTKEDQKRYQEKEIPMHYLVKTDHTSYGKIAESYQGDGRYYIFESADNKVLSDDETKKLKNLSGEEMEISEISGFLDARLPVKSLEYQRICEKLAETVWKMDEKYQKPEKEEKEKILILGTEECMYPGLCVAGKFEKMGINTRFHATTRSPIVVSTENEYPLHERFELKSLYDKERVTYLYDLKKYDRVYIITDADRETAGNGISVLGNALKQKGNDRIHIVFLKNRNRKGCGIFS